MPRRIVGDVVVQIGSEAAAAGARIVFEAKDEVNYPMTKARAEIEEARKNRGAAIGVFVFSKATAPPGTEVFRREGEDIFLVWDADDPLMDVYLQAGLEVARALCTRHARQREEHTLDVVGLEKAILEIERQADDLEKIKKPTETIQSSVNTILERVRIMKDGLERQIGKLRDFKDDLNTHLNVSA